MPRKTYKDRIEAILATGRLSAKDKRFSESLLAHYNRKKALSQGRARCVRTLESRYITNWVDPATTEWGKRFITIFAESLNDWQRGFVESLQEQHQSGRSLSPRQIDVLAKIEAEFNAEGKAAKQAWATTFEKDHRTDFNTLMEYYSKDQYYSSMVNAWRRDPKFVPDQKQFDRMMGNKYAKRIVQETNAKMAYPVGSMVQPRKPMRDMWNRKVGNEIARGFVVKYGPVNAAAKGARVITILPLGAAKPIQMEERQIKSVRI